MSNVRIFTMASCPYCEDLKEKLEAKGVEFTEIDANEDESGDYEKIAKVANSDMLPLIVIGNIILAAEKGFKTINEAVEVIIKLNK